MTHECLLRGWKEICTLLNVSDRRTAKKILNAHGLLKYEGKTPVLIASRYHEKIDAAKCRVLYL